jgi:hypothetical protein
MSPAGFRGCSTGSGSAGVCASCTRVVLMTTDIISIGADEFGASSISVLLLAAADAGYVVLCVLFLTRIWRFPKEVWADTALILLMGIVVARLVLAPLDPVQASPPYWISMGATAITVLAAADLLLLPKDLPSLYAVATPAFGRAAELPLLPGVARTEFWLALGAWAAVAAWVVISWFAPRWPSGPEPSVAVAS